MQEHFNASLNDLLIETPSSIAVALSGGADSFSLLHLAKHWAVEKNIPLVALTVDHRLRRESTEEAEKLHAWCVENKIDHTILTWTDEKPATAIQNTARNKRRQLLFNACAEKNIPVLLMGHQADDQAETFLMRLQRGSGVLGLTGIQPYSYDHATNVSLLRPLLTIRRAALRDYAVEHHLPFIDDPSNDDTAFERVAVRKTLEQLPDLADGVIKTVERLTRVDWALMTTATECFDQHAKRTETGIWLPLSFFTLFEDELCLRVAEQALYTLEPEAYIPLAGLEHLVQDMKQNDFKGQTLAGCRIRPKIRDKLPGFLFEIEPARHI